VAPASPALVLTVDQYRTIIDHCYDGLPDEACGLFGGPVDADGHVTGVVDVVYPCTNADESARTYTVDSRDLLRSLRDAESRGLDLVGVWHSHTHTEAYPSPTDVAQAPDPVWHYVIVSLRDGAPVLRSFRIVGGSVAEEAVALERG
jgi:[CysO sulfur-carrier protein]-S-L-cysteine hydrolase